MFLVVLIIISKYHGVVRQRLLSIVMEFKDSEGFISFVGYVKFLVHRSENIGLIMGIN